MSTPTTHTYTAVTIGPIYKTLHHVKSTKAVWAASYMFSYLIKQLIIKLNITKSEVILPYFEDVNLEKNYDVGLFPDRIMFNKEIADIGKIIDAVIEEFAKLVAVDIKKTETDVNAFLKDYIQFNHVTVSIADNENTIDVLSNYLNTIELKQKTLTYTNEDFLNEFFEKKYYNFLISDVFKNNEKRFPSTIEIAMGEYKKDKTKYNDCVKKLFIKEEKAENEIKNENEPNKIDSSDNQHLFIDEIYKNEDFKKTKRNYQKYIAVIQADGDNVGKLITAIYKTDASLISLFSENLFKFAQKAVELIKAYNGTPIYAGGDDLLFICPVAHTKNQSQDKSKLDLIVEKSIITLIHQIDTLFDSLFKENGTLGPIIETLKDKPSMSYGVSISYYKYPLTQALEQGVTQLFYKAKKTCEKNAVAFNILKHSGQNIASMFHKHLCSYNLFEALLTSKVADDNYVRSITYKLEPQAAVLFGIGCEKDFTNRNEKFDNFFRNNFNEDIHTKRNNKDEKILIDFLEKTKELIKAIYTENPITTIEQSNENLNKVYAALRFVDFLNNEEER